jgi:hypothetical protein
MVSEENVEDIENELPKSLRMDEYDDEDSEINLQDGGELSEDMIDDDDDDHFEVCLFVVVLLLFCPVSS